MLRLWFSAHPAKTPETPFPVKKGTTDTACIMHKICSAKRPFNSNFLLVVTLLRACGFICGQPQACMQRKSSSRTGKEGGGRFQPLNARYGGLMLLPGCLPPCHLTPLWLFITNSHFSFSSFPAFLCMFLKHLLQVISPMVWPLQVPSSTDKYLAIMSYQAFCLLRTSSIFRTQRSRHSGCVFLTCCIVGNFS